MNEEFQQNNKMEREEVEPSINLSISPSIGFGNKMNIE